MKASVLAFFKYSRRVFQTQCLIDDTVVDDDRLEGSVRGEEGERRGGRGGSAEDVDRSARDPEGSVASRTQVCILFSIC